jgi:ribonuclease HI
VKLAENNSIQQIPVPGHMGIDGNETADQLARHGSSHPLTGPEPALGNICKGCQGSHQGLDKQETKGALAVHTWTEAG